MKQLLLGLLTSIASRMCKFWLASVMVVGVVGSAHANPIGWVYRPYLQCDRQGGKCAVADPTGTPLNIRSLPSSKEGQTVATIANGVTVIVLDQNGNWVFIGEFDYNCKLTSQYDGPMHCGEVAQPTKAAMKTGDSIGWVKSSDIECEENDECTLKDNYTDAHKKGVLCATFGIPVYNRPNGNPIGELGADTSIIRGEQYQGYTFVYWKDIGNWHLMPYDPKDLKQCG
jgi:hypothetical protein